MNTIEKKFAGALDALVVQIKTDRAILAAILCGSLSHDTVWSKSDIDLVLVTIDDRQVEGGGVSLQAEGINVHVCLLPRLEFRKLVEGTLQNSFMNSLLAKGRLLYTHDPTITDLCAGLQERGDRDLQIQLLRAATSALPSLYKAHKWFVTRGDLDYTALWILYTATPVALIEVIEARQIAGRELIPQAMKLNPGLFTSIYTGLINARKTKAQVRTALDVLDAYFAERSGRLFGPILEFLEEVGEARSATEINDHFRRNLDVSEAVTACEYLADQGLIGKASIAVRLTRKSTVELQELAFFHLSNAPEEF